MPGSTVSIGAPDAIWLPSSSVPKKLSIESSGSVAAQLKLASNTCPSANVWLLVGAVNASVGLLSTIRPAVLPLADTGTCVLELTAATELYASESGTSLLLGVPATMLSERVHTVPVVVGLGTFTVSVTEPAPGLNVGVAGNVHAPVPLVLVRPTGLSSVTPDGSVSVNVTVAGTPEVFLIA